MYGGEGGEDRRLSPLSRLLGVSENYAAFLCCLACNTCLEYISPKLEDPFASAVMMTRIRFLKKHKFAFMVNMEETGQPLLLTRGGFWTLPEFISPENKFSWYTDVDVVIEGERSGYLVKLLPTPDGYLDGRFLTDKGLLHAVQIREEIRKNNVEARLTRQRQKELRKMQEAEHRVSHGTFLAGQKGVWLRWLSH